MTKATTTETFSIRRPPDYPDLELVLGQSSRRASMRHLHDAYRFGIVESGQWSSFYRGVRYDVRPEHLQIAQPGETSQCEFPRATAYAFRTVSIPIEAMRELWLSDQAGGSGEIVLADHLLASRPLATHFARVHQALMGQRSPLEVSALLQELVRVLRQWAAPNDIGPSSEADAPSALALARDFLAAHPERNVTLRELSDLTQLSGFHLTRLFRRHFGLPPHTFQNHCRVQKAKALLAGGMPQSAIASELGFADQSHFIRTFGRQVGMTPLSYRKGLFRR